jgi:hypothetical protein
MDSTLSGDTFMLNINKGFCNGNSSCTVLGGKVGVMFEDGTEADPAAGTNPPSLFTSQTLTMAQGSTSTTSSPSTTSKRQNPS